jgi:hypothetical protein
MESILIFKSLLLNIHLKKEFTHVFFPLTISKLFFTSMGTDIVAYLRNLIRLAKDCASNYC